MICISTSLPTSIKLPNRIAACGVPEGTCSVPCAAANDASVSVSAHTSAACVNRFIVSLSNVSTENSILTSYPCISALPRQTTDPREQSCKAHLHSSSIDIQIHVELWAEKENDSRVTCPGSIRCGAKSNSLRVICPSSTR